MIITKTKYIEELEQDTSPEAEGRIDNLHELLAVTTEFDKNAKPTANKLERLAEFLEQVTLMADVDTMETNGKMVTLMTLHSAKGLEFPIIFMVGMEESLLPHAHALDEPEEMEEERRLCYVGMTRAKERLVFTRAETRIFYGEIKHNLPSSFLEDIPGELVNRVKIGDDDDCKVIDLYAYVKKRVIEPPKMPVEQNNRPPYFLETRNLFRVIV